jgi:hypothetical protein
MACTPTTSTWSRSSRGGAVALGARGPGPLMVASGLKGSQILSSPMRRHVLSGRHAWWKVEQGLDSLSMPFLTLPLLHSHYHATT